MFDVQCLHCTVAVAKCAQLCCHFKTKKKKAVLRIGATALCVKVLWQSGLNGFIKLFCLHIKRMTFGPDLYYGESM